MKITTTRTLTHLSVFLSLGTGTLFSSEPAVVPTLKPALQLVAPGADDQDDHCIWRSPSDPRQSMIICSDKAASKLFVYSLTGEVLQSIDVSMPGNIDLRQNVNLGGTLRDVVVVNQREPETMLRVYFVDPQTRKLEQVDDHISTGENYGGCLAYDSAGQKLYFLSTAKGGNIEQIELVETDEGKVKGKLARTWKIGYCEGAVADDSRGTAYIAEEEGTIWKFGFRPQDSTPGEKVAAVGESGLKGDLEGLALLPHPDHKEPLLVVSDQGRNRFVVFTTDSGSRKICEFAVDGVEETDGIEIHAQPLGDQFPAGIFVCHTDLGDRAPVVVDLREILQLLDSTQLRQSDSE